MVATASFYRSVAFTAEAARLLDRTDEADRWTELAGKIKNAFRSHYVNDDGTIFSDCATLYALAISFDLLEHDQHAWAGKRLVEVVADRDYRVTTGFAGTPFVTWALSETGHVDDAYRLLLEEGCPSWLYPVSMGRHHHLGALGLDAAGRVDQPRRHDLVQPLRRRRRGRLALQGGRRHPARHAWLRQPAPRPDSRPGLDWARGALDTRHGRMECGWRPTADGFTVDVEVPEHVSTELTLPDGTVHAVASGRHSFASGRSPE